MELVMRKFGCALFAALTVVGIAFGQDGGRGSEGDLFRRRLGLFVHWGIYSVDGYHEQQRRRLHVGRAEYEKRIQSFTAERFCADAWVDAAESLGADYIVFTAKHHDGFCLWDTKTTSFNVMNSPAGRDVVRELAEACRRRGMRLGLYYSNPDWHHPNAYNPLSTHQVPPEEVDRPDMNAYKEYVKAQISELLTNYGEIACLFWDIPTKIAAPEMNALVRRLQPGIHINDRGWGGGGDYSTPERSIPDGAAFTNLTEACDSVGAQSWGYRMNEDYRTLGYATRAVDRILTMGGNFLFNVGPKADGTIPAEALDLLGRAGDWYRRVRESYQGVSTASGTVEADDAMVTCREGVTYLHYPKGLWATGVSVSPLARTPRRAILLNTGTVLKTELTVMPNEWEKGQKVLHVYGIPADRVANESAVIKLEW